MASKYDNKEEHSLTSLGELQLGSENASNEMFETACQICEDTDHKEAVGYCLSCDKYMCFSCIKHHKKIPLLQSHDVLGKEKFVEKSVTKGLFQRQLIPVATTVYPEDVFHKTTHSKLSLFPTQILQVQCVPGCKDNVFLLYQYQSPTENVQIIQDVFELGKVDEENGYKDVFTEFSRDIFKDQPQSCTEKNRKCENELMFFVVPRPSKVLAYCNRHSQVFQAFQLPTGAEGLNIAMFNKGLALSVRLETSFNLPEWRIQHVSFSGEVITDFIYDKTGNPLFKHPNHLISNETQDILFILDCKDKAVKAMDTKGMILFCYKHELLQFPTSITFDEENNIYVASQNKVIQIDKLWKHTRELLTAERGQIITNICYNKVAKRLTVVDNKHQITMFKYLP